MKFIFANLLLLSALALVGCLQTRDELNDMEFSRSTQSQVNSIQKNKAEQENKVVALQEELREALGRIDVLERRLAEQRPQQASGPTNADLIEQMKIFEQSLTQLKTKLEELESKLATTQIQAAQTQKPGVAPDAKNKSVWDVGEESFDKKDWKVAILSYQNYRDQNPKGANYAQATYKIGVCFQELKMKDEAKAFFEEVLQKFPKSPAARKAKFRLGQLK